MAQNSAQIGLSDLAKIMGASVRTFARENFVDYSRFSEFIKRGDMPVDGRLHDRLRFESDKRDDESLVNHSVTYLFGRDRTIAYWSNFYAETKDQRLFIRAPRLIERYSSHGIEGSTRMIVQSRSLGTKNFNRVSDELERLSIVLS